MKRETRDWIPAGAVLQSEFYGTNADGVEGTQVVHDAAYNGEIALMIDSSYEATQGGVPVPYYGDMKKEK